MEGHDTSSGKARWDEEHEKNRKRSSVVTTHDVSE
jgi:hypothetical protein